MEKIKQTKMWVVSDTFTLSHSYAHPSIGEQEGKKKSKEHLVYGLKGLADFLHQSVTTAWRLKKSGKYDAAISQRGRCIITDTDKLLELMRLDVSANNQINNIHYYY